LQSNRSVVFLMALEVAAIVPIVALGLARRTRPAPRLGPLAATAAVAALGCAALAAWAVARGTSPHGLLDGLLIRPLGFPKSFWHVFGFSKFYLLGAWSAAALGVALACRPALLDRPAVRRTLDLARLGLFLVVVAGVASGRTMELFLLALPWSWLVIVPYEGDDRAGEPGRLALAGVTCLASLQVYPVAGSQLLLAVTPLGVVALVCLSDALRSPWLARLFPVPARAGLAGTSVALVAALIGGLAVAARERYKHNEPLDLPGARLVRLEPAEARSLRRVARWLDDECDTFVTLPGYNSLYFLARKVPPTSLNTTDWMVLLDADQQQEVVEALSARSRIRAVRIPALAEHWLKNHPVGEPPLMKFINGFEAVERVGGFVLLAPRGHNGASSPGGAR
jgi:hypothetical protein